MSVEAPPAAAEENERSERRETTLLWVFGLFVVTALVSLLLARIAMCGAALGSASCEQQFTNVLWRTLRVPYVAIGAVALLLVASAALRKHGAHNRAADVASWLLGGAAALYALVSIVALGEYYLIAVAAVHWILLHWLEPRRVVRPASALAEFGAILVAWAAAATAAWAQPLSSWLLGSPGSIPGVFVLIVFVLALVLNVLLLRAPQRQRSDRVGVVAWVIDGLAMAVFIALSFRQHFFGDPNAVYHWGFFIGPAELVRQGGWLLWDDPSQYGFLSILSIALMPFRSTWTAMYVLDALLVLASAAMTFYVTRSLRLGPLSGVFAFVTTLVTVFLMPGYYQTWSGPQDIPSIGAFRFIWVDTLLLVLAVDFASDGRIRRRRATVLIGTAVWLLGVLWSAESAIYVTFIWIPSLLLLLVTSAEGRSLPARLRCLARGETLRLLLAPAAFALVALAAIQLIYFVSLGHGPDYFAFVDFGLQYASGFGALPINGLGAVWLLVLAFAACTTACLIVVRRRSWRALPLLYAASSTVWVISSYFIGRAADSNVTNVFTPLWLSLSVVLFVLDRENVSDDGARYLRAMLVAPLTVVIALTIGNWAAFSGLLAEFRSGFTPDVAGLMGPFSDSARAILREAGAKASDAIVYDNSAYLMPEPTDAGDAALPARAWLPANPPILVTVIPAARKFVYFDRFIARRPMQGWYLRAPSDKLTCESLDPQYVTAKSYRSAAWDLSFCRLNR